jgi:hypothetical protein
MIKTNLFDCEVDDKIFFTGSLSYGVIESVTKERITVYWSHSEETAITAGSQTISLEMYSRIADWRHVFCYENDKDLLMIRLKYIEND